MSSNDMIQRFYTLIQNLKINHQNDIDILNQRICELETQNRQLHEYHQQQGQPHPHSIFDINYMPNDDSSTVEQLKIDLQKSQDQIAVLQSKVDQQHCEYDDMMAKYTLKNMINGNNNETSKVFELESKLKQIKDQINRFEQCHYESDEQIRLLKQLISTNDSEQINTITQSLTVKQADLHQQTDIVVNILNKQQEKIIENIVSLFEQNSKSNQPKKTTATTTKKLKKKRL